MGGGCHRAGVCVVGAHLGLPWRLLWRVLFCVCSLGCAPPCGGLCVPVLQAPAVGQGSPTLRPLWDRVGRVTCGFLQPTTGPPRGAWGMAKTCGLWCSLTDPEGAQAALHRVQDPLGPSWWMEGPGVC